MSQDLIDYYKNLLIVQYNNKPKARGTLDALIGELIANDLIPAIRDGFNIDTAVGIQLDIIGLYRGVLRAIFGISLGKSFLSMPSYADHSSSVYPGVAVYADGVPSIFWAHYADAVSPAYVMSDGEMRKLIKYTSDLHALDLGLGSIDVFLYKWFTTYVTLTDNGDMTMTYHEDTSDPDTLFKIAKFTNRLPKPSGVELLYV